MKTVIDTFEAQQSRARITGYEMIRPAGEGSILMAPSTRTEAGWTPARFRKTEPTTLDPTLLERVARGEPGAIETCLDSYGGLVWTLARRMCTTPADAASSQHPGGRQPLARPRRSARLVR